MPIVSQLELIQGVIAGQVVSFPTDTVPALAVIPEHSELIFALKGRSLDKPLILMAASATDLWSYVTGTAEELALWQTIAQRYFPGQLTLVLPASPQVPRNLNPLNPSTIGIRVPNQPIAQTILSQTGPLATTSANLSGESPLETSSAIAAEFPEILTLESDELTPQKRRGSGLPSTVIKWTGQGWEVLRQGNIKFKEEL
jgi:L-threonylcarbamoyladenylate synthase